MSLLKIALRSILQRGVASSLTTFSMALGVMLVVAVLSIHGVVEKSFKNNADLGYNIIVGATKGGKLQLTLNSVYYLSSPVENIPYDYYLEFVSPEKRAEEYKQSIAANEFDSRWDTAQSDALLLSGAGGGSIASILAMEATREFDQAELPAERRGKFSAYTGMAIPILMGDYFGRFRCIGTSPDFFNELEYDVEKGLKYKFREGQNFKTWSPERGYFEAVIGNTVAIEKGVGVGDTFSPSHGDPDGEGHAQKFTIVGVLAPSGKPVDRGVFVNMEGFYLMEDHAKPVKEEPVDEDEEPVERVGDADDEANKEANFVMADADMVAPAPPVVPVRTPLPVEQREVTAVLIRTQNPMAGVYLPEVINEGNVAQAALPILEITNLFDAIVAPFQWLLVILTGMICFVSGVSILVSIYNSMNDRKRDIAVMRALGAGRESVMTIILLESVMLATAGGLLGWITAHALNVIASPYIEHQTGVTLSFFQLSPGWNLLEMLQDSSNGSGDPEMLLTIIAGSLLAIGGIAWLIGAVMTGIGASQSGRGPGGMILSALAPPWVLLSALKPSRYVSIGLAVWTLGFVLVILVAPVMAMNWEISSELLLVPALLLLAVLVGFLPAITAYNTDIGEAL